MNLLGKRSPKAGVCKSLRTPQRGKLNAKWDKKLTGAKDMGISALSQALSAQAQMGQLVTDVMSRSVAQTEKVAALSLEQKVQANANNTAANALGANLDVYA